MKRLLLVIGLGVALCSMLVLTSCAHYSCATYSSVKQHVNQGYNPVKVSKR